MPALAIGGKYVVESLAVAEHLEQAYPDTPALFPAGTRALQAAFLEFFTAQAFGPIAKILVPGVPGILDPAGAEYVRETRRAWTGTPVDEWAPVGSEKRKNAWKAAEEGWGKLAAVYRQSNGVWITGAQPVFADFVVLGALIFASKTVPEEEWKAVLAWHDGIWGRLWKAGEQYMQAE